MAKKLCPICDHELNLGNYCKICRKIVKHPVVFKSDMYLNERHPGGEANCDFHRISTSRGFEDQAQPQPPKAVVKDMFHTEEQDRAKKKVSFLFTCVPVFFFLIGLLQIGSNAFTNQFSDHAALPVGEYGGAVQEEDSFYRELTEDEMQAMDTHCNSYGHFKLDAMEIMPAMVERSLFYGYDIAEAWSESTNYVIAEEEEPFYWFENRIHLPIYQSESHSRDDGSLSVEVSSDTVTNEVHSMIVYVSSEEHLVGFMETFVGLIEASAGTQEADSKIPEFRQALESQFGQEPTFYRSVNDYIIYSGSYDGIYYLSVTVQDGGNAGG